ncbi:MAG: hypothetical protein D6693_02100, partial [Planctomycetota bacterium]
MTATTGVIPIPDGDEALAQLRVLGAPMALWAVNNLRRALPIERIVVVTRDDAIGRMARLNGVRVLDAAPDGAVIRHDLARPFLSRAALVRALDAGAEDAHAHADTPIEGLRVGENADAALVEAVARGLAPD